VNVGVNKPRLGIIGRAQSKGSYGLHCILRQKRRSARFLRQKGRTRHDTLCHSPAGIYCRFVVVSASGFHVSVHWSFVQRVSARQYTIKNVSVADCQELIQKIIQ